MVKRILVVSPNWIGDFVMALPAFQRFRAARPDAEISVLAKESVAPLWDFVDGVSRVFALRPGNRATFAAARELRGSGFAEAVILPNSFRSALIPFLARIPVRRGTPRHARALLVNDRVVPLTEAVMHQSFEDEFIMSGTYPGALGPAGFHPPAPNASGAIGVIPGAARGPSKRYPHFAEAAKLILKEKPDARFTVFGGAGEAALCEETAKAIGPAAENRAGRTSLAEFASELSGCSCVLCNDSGGMHLASASGVPVVAVFGCTDPEKTGPIGANAKIVRAEGVKASREIGRDDPAAVAALASIDPARVAAAWKELSERGPDAKFLKFCVTKK